MLRNIFDQVKADAVAQARRGDPRLMSLGANVPGEHALDSQLITFPDSNGNTIEPFVVDETPVDSPNAYLL